MGTVKIYVTKYALTTGIETVKAEISSDYSMAYTDRRIFHGEGKDWHRTLSKP